MPDTLISSDVLANRVPAATCGDGQTVQELWDAYRKAWRKFSKAMDGVDAAMLRALPHLPPRPASLSRELELVEGGTKTFNLDETLIGELKDEGVLTLDEANALRSELHNWNAACETVANEHGRREAKAAYEVAEQAFREVETALTAAPIRSRADVIPKLLSIIEREDLSDDDADTLRAAIRYLRKKD